MVFRTFTKYIIIIKERWNEISTRRFDHRYHIILILFENWLASKNVQSYFWHLVKFQHDRVFSMSCYILLLFIKTLFISFSYLLSYSYLISFSYLYIHIKAEFSRCQSIDHYYHIIINSHIISYYIVYHISHIIYIISLLLLM